MKRTLRILAALACATLVFQLPAARASQNVNSGKFTIVCLEMPDVGRGVGLAVILRTPGGRTYLYDTGVGYPVTTNASGWETGFNAGKDQIAPYLAKNNIHQIDGVFISHAHLDHYGGLLWLEDHYPIKRLYDSGYQFPGKLSAAWQSELSGYDDLRARFKARNAYSELHTGDHVNIDPALNMEVIAPPRQYFSEAHPERRSSADPPEHYLVNANSLEVRIQHGNVIFLFPGDIEKEDQVGSLLPATPPAKMKTDILIAPGHGLSSTQAQEFANATRPKIVIASLCTRWADHSNAQQLYGNLGAKVYLTGLSGAITITSDGEHYTVNTER